MSRFKPFKKLYNALGEETFAHIHEKKPNSRRDFLATGLLPFAAYMTMPSILQIMASANFAEAAEMACPTGGSPLVPLITLNLAGGAGLAANWIPLDQGGNLLKEYTKLGLGQGGSLPTVRAMGSTFAGNGLSNILAGIQAEAATAMVNTKFVGVPVRSRDDSTVNKFDISGMATKAGHMGDFLPNLGSRNSKTGNRNEPAFITPPTPLAVNSFSDLTGSIGVAGSLDKLSKSEKTKMFKMVKDLNTAQARKLASASGGEELGLLVKCSSGKNYDFSSKDNSALSPLSNQAVSDIWNINNNTSMNSRDMVFASMVYSGLMGFSGTVNLEMGGYDYHNGTRTSGDTRDRQAGDIIGRILATAEALSRPVFIVVTSDGGVTSPISDSRQAPWRSDRGSAGAAYMLAYDPSNAPISSSGQLGHFNQAQAADENFITGGSPELASAAIFANYLSFNNRMDLLEQVIPRTFSSDQLKLITKISKA